MAKTSNLLDLDVEKLFIEHSIEEIVLVDKQLDVEIERKRNELRSMVGDRYKDVLAASDAIKYLRNISEDIVGNIEQITGSCEVLLQERQELSKTSDSNKVNNEMRSLIVQIRLAIFLNEQIWMGLDKNCSLEAAQYYLLAQHLHTGLNLMKKEVLEKIPLLQQVKATLVVLRSKIFEKIAFVAEEIQPEPEEVSNILTALLLLQNQSNEELLLNFLQHRKQSLKAVLSGVHPNVRQQISTLVLCIISTIRLVFNCFISSQNNGLIAVKLEEITGAKAQFTINKLTLPATPLLTFLPEIIKQFKPNSKVSTNTKPNRQELSNKFHVNFLDEALSLVQEGLTRSLLLVTTVKGLHLIREEVFNKTSTISHEENWKETTSKLGLPANFNVWFYFFQKSISLRALVLIQQNLQENYKQIEEEIQNSLKNLSGKQEDLRQFCWNEDLEDVKKTINSHEGLTFKTKGFTRELVELCAKFDDKFEVLLQDVQVYLQGNDLRNCQDDSPLDDFLQNTCRTTILNLSAFVQKQAEGSLEKSLFLSRFLRAILELCQNFQRIFHGNEESWKEVTSSFQATSNSLLKFWIEKQRENTKIELAKLEHCSRINGFTKTLCKWDCVEIEEEIDGKLVKSEVKVPLKPTLALYSVLVRINDDLSRILPHTLPKTIHLEFINENVNIILLKYLELCDENLNETQALQLLFDVKFLNTFFVSRDNESLMQLSGKIAENLQEKIDPIELDILYGYLLKNVKKAVGQSQMFLGCLLPSSNQLANLGVLEKSKEQDKEPSILSLSVPSNNAWFPLLPITKPSNKMAQGSKDLTTKPIKLRSSSLKKLPENAVKSSAVSLFGTLTTDWFS